MWVRTTNKDVVVNLDFTQYVYIRSVEEPFLKVVGKKEDPEYSVSYAALDNEFYALGLYHEKVQAEAAYKELLQAIQREEMYFEMPIFEKEGEDER
jgi:hypothetical protein